MSPAQLPLPIALPPPVDFADFDPGEDPAVPAAVAAFAAEPRGVLLLLGPSGSGKTHLLAAACRERARRGGEARYLALAEWDAERAAALAALGDAELLALDGLEHAAGCRPVELALFALANRQQDRGGGLLVASRIHPDELPALLPDLRSRLLAGLRLRLRPLPETSRRRLLEARARALGLRLEPPAIEYLFRRHARDLKSLMALLARLDRETLARQRPVTVALLRELLGRGAD